MIDRLKTGFSNFVNLFTSPSFGGGGSTQQTAPTSTPDPNQSFGSYNGRQFNYAGKWLGGGTQDVAQQNTGGGGFTATTQPTADVPQETAPSEPDVPSIESLIQPALDELGSFEAETRSLLSGGEAQAEAFGAAAEAKAEQSRQEGRAETEAFQREQEAKAEEAEFGQRRGFAEIAKGLRSRFGSAVSTGLGAEAIAGGKTMEAIGRIRAGIAETVAKVNARKQQLDDIFNSAAAEARFQVENLKQQSKVVLQQALSEINARRGELLTRRADMVNNALQIYRQNIIDINSRNTAYMQRLDEMRRQTNESIRLVQAKASNIINNLDPFTLTGGEVKAFPISQLGGELGVANIEQQLAGSNIQFGTAGDYGLFQLPTDEQGNPLKVNFGATTPVVQPTTTTTTGTGDDVLNQHLQGR